MIAIEVGGSSTQAIALDGPRCGSVVLHDDHREEPWLLAAPGLVEGDRVRGAHHLGWMDVQPSGRLGMSSPPLLSMNDVEAAALGEWVLRGCPNDTSLYISMGTGVGAVIIRRGEIVPVEFGHLTSFGLNQCGGCGRLGCLDAQIGGHALPTPLSSTDIEKIVSILERAIERQATVPDRIVIGAGLPRRYPQVVTELFRRIHQPVEPSISPAHLKSAASFGLRHAWIRANDGATNSAPGD